MIRTSSLIRCLLAAAIFSSFAAFGDTSRVTPARYELTGYSQHYGNLQIYSAKFTADNQVRPIRRGVNYPEKRPFLFDKDDPEDFVEITEAYLPKCQLKGEGLWRDAWFGQWTNSYGNKSDDNYGNGIAIRDPDSAHERLDVYYCDNNYLYLIKDGITVYEPKDDDLPGSNDPTPSFARWVPQFSDKIYLARGKWFCIAEVTLKKGQRTLNLDKEKHCYDQTEGYDDSIEGVARRIHLQNHTIFNQALYENYHYANQVDGTNQQSGLSIHFRQDGQVRVMSTQSSRFHQQHRATPSDAILLELPLDPETGYPPKGAKFRPASMPMDLMNTMVVTQDPEEKKTDDCYSLGCTLFGQKDPDQDAVGNSSYSPLHRATVKGKRPTEGDLTSCTSNAIYEWHQNMTGGPDTFRDYLFCRFHHSHSGWLLAPTGVSEGIEETTIDAKIEYIDSYKEEENPYHFTAQYETADTPAVTIALLAGMAKTLPRVIYGEALKHQDAPRKRLDKKDRVRDSSSLDQTIQIHTGEILLIEAGIGRSETEKPIYQVEIEVDGVKKITTRPAKYDGFEIYRQPRLEDWYSTLETTKGANGVTPSWKAKDRDLKDKLLTRIPRPYKGYFDSFSWTMVLKPEDAAALTPPAREESTEEPLNTGTVEDTETLTGAADLENADAGTETDEESESDEGTESDGDIADGEQNQEQEQDEQ
ncbi:MAG: hypothetical protein ACR2PT_22135 [Endozoicomonas sp.]